MIPNRNSETNVKTSPLKVLENGSIELTGSDLSAFVGVFSTSQAETSVGALAAEKLDSRSTISSLKIGSWILSRLKIKFSFI
jgi:hypothetical protein